MAKKATIIAVCNQKGGVAKTTTVENLGIGMADAGKRVLLIDNDPQASLTVSLGWPQPDQLPLALPDLLTCVADGRTIPETGSILHHEEGIDVVPANISLAGLEISLVNTMSRETVLKKYLKTVEKNYDFILIDGMPSLGLLTVNMLAAADSVLIPVQPQYLSAKGLEQLLTTIHKVRTNINPSLRIEGILLTMVDGRTNYAKEITSLIRETYGGRICVYDTAIPRSVRAAECSVYGKSIFRYDPMGKVADAYRSLTAEVIRDDTRRRKRALEPVL